MAKQIKIIHYYKSDELDKWRTTKSYLKFYAWYYTVVIKHRFTQAFHSQPDA